MYLDCSKGTTSHLMRCSYDNILGMYWLCKENDKRVKCVVLINNENNDPENSISQQRGDKWKGLMRTSMRNQNQKGEIFCYKIHEYLKFHQAPMVVY